jgi:hypothetical protein
VLSGSDLDLRERLARTVLTAPLAKRIERPADSAALAFGTQVLSDLGRSEPAANSVVRAGPPGLVGCAGAGGVIKPSKIIAMTKRPGRRG